MTQSKTMKPIVVLAVVGMAAFGLGFGTLNNNISLNVQQLGVGESDLVSPIDDAKVQFGISKIPSNLGGFKNVIRNCVITNTDAQQDPIPALSTIYCKLTDEDGNVAAEGTKVLTTQLPFGISTKVPISDGPLIESQVQNIHDLILVVQGPSAGN